MRVKLARDDKNSNYKVSLKNIKIRGKICLT